MMAPSNPSRESMVRHLAEVFAAEYRRRHAWRLALSTSIWGHPGASVSDPRVQAPTAEELAELAVDVLRPDLE